MVIKIEDAPHIKHLKIDINFDDNDSTSSVVINSDGALSNSMLNAQNPQKNIQEQELDLTETFEVQDTVVEKPEIPEIVRDVKVSDDMVNAQF